jgi:hypothetical protein
MKIAAGCIALLIAVILLGGALMDYVDNEKENIHRAGADAALIGNDTAFYRRMDEIKAERNSESIRAIVGGGFLVAGLFILGRKSPKPK